MSLGGSSAPAAARPGIHEVEDQMSDRRRIVVIDNMRFKVIVVVVMSVVFGWLMHSWSVDPADVNRDGVVNVLDVQLVANAFLLGK